MGMAELVVLGIAIGTVLAVVDVGVNIIVTLYKRG